MKPKGRGCWTFTSNKCLYSQYFEKAKKFAVLAESDYVFQTGGGVTQKVQDLVKTLTCFGTTSQLKLFQLCVLAGS